MIDYSKYADAELRECLDGIDRERFPENYEALIKEIQSRKSIDGKGCKAESGLENDSPSSIGGMLSLDPDEIRQSLSGSSTKKHNYILWGILSVVLYAAIVSGRCDLRYALMIVPVIFVHEFGHYVLMRILGYKKVSIFFIPFFGAITKGEISTLNKKNEAIVSLSGPLLGILVAILALYVNKYFGRPRMLRDFIYYSFVLNLLNLIPILPFDGGMVWDSLLTSRNSKVSISFNVISSAVMLMLAVKFKIYVLGLVIFLTWLKINEMILAQRVLAKLPYSMRSANVTSDGFIGAVLKEFELITLNPNKKRTIVKNRTVSLIRNMNSESASVAFSFAIAMTYLLVTAISIIVFVGISIARH